MNMQAIEERKRLYSPVITPQALAWDGRQLWLSSRDLGTLNTVDSGNWKITAEIDPPGVVWAAVASNGSMYLTIGKGLNDDRYVYRYSTDEGFRKLFPCPELTGSYLSFDGKHCYLSQWYKGDIHEFDDSGTILRTINVGAEICGHTFAHGTLYVLRGKENKDVPGKSEEWRIARLDVHESTAQPQDLATVPFESRSLTFDGENFWSNHRAANEIVSFSIPS